MAVSKDRLKQGAMKNLEELGFDNNDSSRFEYFVKALMDAWVDEYQENGEAIISSGSSAGRHKVQ